MALAAAGLPRIACPQEKTPESNAVELTEKADTPIERGLRFLAKNQHDDGGFGSGAYNRNVAVSAVAGLAFLAGRYRLGAALGALGGPLAFWIGARLGAVELGLPAWRSLLVLGAVWAIAVPLLTRIAAGDRDPSTTARYRGMHQGSS